MRAFILTSIFCLCFITITANPENPQEHHIKKDSLDGNIEAFAFSLIPGFLIHGSGHYMAGDKETGYKLLKIEGVSFLTLIASITGLALGGNADEFSGFLVPVAAFSGGTFMASWIFDILGTTGLSKNLITRNPNEISYFDASIVQQDNNQNSLYKLYNGTFQYGSKSYFIKIGAEFDDSGIYQEYKLKTGYDFLNKELYKFYLIPEAKYKYSSEGFSITQFDIQGEFEINLASLSNSLKNIYFTNNLGYGNEWFDFNNNGIDFTNGFTIISQGVRMHITDYIDLSSKYIRSQDELIGGTGVILTHFKHSLKLRYKKLFTEMEFHHGQGYRLTTKIGVEL